MRARFVAIAAAVAAATVSAMCPNGCSGNGECGPKDACVCFTGFGSADCSQRLCPSGLAFVDIPRGDLNHDGMLGMGATLTSAYSSVQWSLYKQYEYWPRVSGMSSGSKYKAGGAEVDPAKLPGGGWVAAVDEAHFYSECSGKGVCDRELGACRCYDGYTGNACQRTSCPNGCSGHGICRTAGEIAAGARNKEFTGSFNGHNYFSGVQSAFGYRLWDADKHQTCVCDPGYTGNDCGQRVCPMGDDPLTTDNSMCGNSPCANEVQGFTITGTGANDAKNYRIRYRHYTGEEFLTRTFALNTDTTSASKMAANAATIEAALEALPSNITGQVTVSSAGDGTATPNVRLLITFTVLSGNVPELMVERAPVNPGGSLVAQPAQPVQVIASLPAAPAGSTISATLFPQQPDGFRKAQFSSAAAVTVAGGSATDVLAAINDALQSAASGVPALTYTVGTSSISLDLTAGKLTLVMPNKNFGAVGVRLTFVNGGTTTVRDATLDTADGNKEYKVCSDRGICNFDTGLCKCFPGYVGAACQAQNALAM